MFDDEVIILHALDISCNTSVDVVGFFVVLQILMIGKYRGYMG
jgi:hypothetical protein